MNDRAPGWRRAAGWAEARGWRIVLLAFALGLIAALGQAPFGLWGVTVLGIGAGFWLWTRAAALRRAALIGWGFGAGYFGLTMIWIVQPFLVDVAQYGWMAPFALVGFAGGLALFWGAGFGAARWLAPGGRFGWIAFGTAMGAAELGRATLLTGFPWGGPGQAWIDTGLAQMASLVGAYGLTVLTFAGSAGIVVALQARRVWPALAVGTAVALALAAGLWIGRGAVPERASPVALRLVQPNATQHLKWHPDWVGVFLDRALELTAAPVAAGARAPDLVIWPETSVPSFLGEVPSLQAQISAAAAPARVIAGARRVQDRRIYNSLVLFSPTGAPAAIYDKHHVVPFGEYVPLGDLMAKFGIYGMAVRDGYGYSSGPGAMVLDLPDGLGKALPLICYEAIFPRDLRAAPERADWILQITNDGWFGTFSGPQQHLVQARFRAIELGLPFVRAANTGISAAIDARGRVVGALELNTAGVLDVALPGALPPTFFAKWGDAPMVLLLFFCFVGLFIRRRVKPIDPRESGK